MGRKRKYCPVCAEPLGNGVPCACGYDPSMDFENHLCLCRLSEPSASLQSIHYKHRTYEERRTAEIRSLQTQAQEAAQRNTELEKQLAELKKRCDGLLTANQELERMASGPNQETERYRVYLDEVKLYLDDVIQEREHVKAELRQQQELVTQVREHAHSREAALRQALSQAYYERDQLGKLLEDEMRRRS